MAAAPPALSGTGGGEPESVMLQRLMAEITRLKSEVGEE